MSAGGVVIGGLPLLVWVGHAAQALLVLACAAITWSTSRRAKSATESWQRFWSSQPWLATAACGLVMSLGAISVLEMWVHGFETGWASVRLISLSLGERLSIQWWSVIAALGLWGPLVLWPAALGLSRSGRLQLALAVACFWAGLGWAAWSCRDFLVQLPETMGPTYLAFDALEPARVRLARGVLALAFSLGVAGGLVGWALWHRPARAIAREYRVGSAGVALLGGAAVLILMPLGSRFAWENAHPFDTAFGFTFCDACEPQEPGLAGRAPDDPVNAPWVILGPSEFQVDGSRLESHDELYAILKSKRELWSQVHPGRAFPGAVMLHVRELRTVADLDAAFRTVLRAGYTKAHLAYSEIIRQTRPVFGRVFGRRNSALRVFLAQWRGDCPVPSARVLHLGAASARPVATWAHELSARTDGNVCLVLPTLDCPTQVEGCPKPLGAGFEVAGEWSLGERVEALRLRRGEHEYEVAFVGPKTTIEVELMNDPRDPWDGFHALEARIQSGRRRLIWAMNAGMYHPDRSPVGLLVSRSNERSRLNIERGKGNFFLMPNGVFEVTQFGPGVQTTSAWRDDLYGETREATQSGPMLVVAGRLHPAFENDSPSRLIRNGVGVADETVVMAISTTRVNFYEFASFMRDLGCSDALYLDGNVSSVFAPGLERRDPGLGLGPVLVVTEATR